MMRITQDFLNHLSPVELSFIRTGIDKLYKEKTLWSDGYFAASIGQVSQATIEHYIENQG